MLRFILAGIVTTPGASASADSTPSEAATLLHNVHLPMTRRQLCEPADERWKLGPEGRQDVKRRIAATATALGADPRAFKAMAMRESSFRPSVRHKMKGDVTHALTAYFYAAHLYGWDVFWPWKQRRSGDMSSMKLIPLGDGPRNQHYGEPERWTTSGLGPFGLNPAYHLAKWDALAEPEVLCDPEVATIVAVRIARRAVDRFGAKSWVEVNAVFAGRFKRVRDRQGRSRVVIVRHAKKDASFCTLADNWGFHCDDAPKLGTKLGSSTAAHQTDFATRLRGQPLPLPELALLDNAPKNG